MLVLIVPIEAFTGVSTVLLGYPSGKMDSITNDPLSGGEAYWR